jgi:hypothetical protein
MDNAQKHSICINVPSSQTFTSYFPIFFGEWQEKLVCGLDRPWIDYVALYPQSTELPFGAGSEYRFERTILSGDLL